MPAVRETNETKLPTRRSCSTAGAQYTATQAPHYRDQGITVDKTSESSSNSGLALVAGGLWLHIGLIGAIAVAAGLTQWLQDPRLPWSPVVAIFGCVLAVASWRRGFAVLERTERQSAVATDTSSESIVRVLQSDRSRREGPVVTCSAATITSDGDAAAYLKLQSLPPARIAVETEATSPRSMSLDLAL